MTLLLRPRAAAAEGVISPDRAETLPNRLHGQVMDCVFRGDGYRLEIKTEHGSLLSFYVDQVYPPGQALNLRIAEEGVQFFAEEE